MASAMFQSAYGYQLKGHEDPFFTGAQEALENFCSAQMTEWKRTARRWGKQKDWVLDSTFQWTKDQVASGSAETSIVGALLDHQITSKWTQEDKEYRLKELGIVLFSGGTESLTHTLVGFIAAMVLNPGVQLKAQKEIDKVLGLLKLSKLEDKEQLPYVRNLILETLRWHPVLPTAVPHVCYEDNVYRCYDIPKGTVLIGNLWSPGP
ncbi:unnamed protein product [Rhizoctonia solani]|uniref:O-methylsterigmatocystin oxidoreductase n=1 Tax=Rhizoctonia solani TaxID=456999 RepID=A0A8H3BFV0_9AGAM|nr:unnamed protein product [Rhizoctonia solani]